MFKLVDEVVRIVTGAKGFIEVFEGAKRIDIPLTLPSRVVREAIVNALVHRNYAIESETFVIVDKDEICFMNPGEFPPEVDPSDPLPIPRNPLLYEIMFQANYVEKEGFGIKMMREECRKIGVEMLYEIKSSFTKLIFRIPRKVKKREI